ncbi:MAG: 4Fe-4S binding protein, partial [Pirellulaceae bacterium]
MSEPSSNNGPIRSRTTGRLLSVAFLVLATLLGSGLALQLGSVSEWSLASWCWGWLVAGLALFLGIMFLQSNWGDQRSTTLLRLDWFLPAVRRLPVDAKPAKSLFGKWLRKLTPGLQSDWQKKKRGQARKVLRWFGISWVASPVRRLSQASCLLLFCWLFFYVCWPYHARPVQPQVLGELRFATFDQESGVGRFDVLSSGLKEDSQSSKLAESSWFLRPKDGSSNLDGQAELLGEFTLVENADRQVALKPLGDLSPMLMDVITGLSDSTDFIATDRDPIAWPNHYAESLGNKEWIPAETFLMIDPLVSLSTAIASRSWVWSLGCAAAILLVCVVIPRGFCGYLCPLGTTIDLFDWAIAGRTKRFQVPGDGWWVHVKYCLLAAILLAATGGILISGFFSAIPVVTRGYLFLFDPLQSGMTRGWHLIPSLNAGHLLSVVLFFGVLGLGFLRPRFWCKYVCPSGAVFSIGNLFRATER